ncbi:TRAP transporter small permease [Pelagibius sp. CAU 1746]|uniref:TRAP transporter small permease n=1 Tax=Pelagibius sp. CAU 1746 TaxID=3140370 RepID=UPI00325B9264
MLERIDRVSHWAIVLVMGGMASIVSIQVLFRYVFNYSIDSADELSRLFFVWSIFLSIPHGVRFGIHVGIDLLVRNLDEAVKDKLGRSLNAVSAVLMGFVFVIGWQATMDKWPELMPTLPVSAGLYYVAVVICAGHSFLHLVYLAWHGNGAWDAAQNADEMVS